MMHERDERQQDRDEQQAELLDRYWLTLQHESDAEPAEALDPEVAATARSSSAS
jgi:hypothetical protein